MVVIISMVVSGVLIPCTFIGGYQLLEEQVASIFMAEERSQTLSLQV
jgi:hypothetical protein